MFSDNLGDRMKNHYENIPKTRLIQEVPVIIRIDGKAFHTFTKKFQKPFDDVLVLTMQQTTANLCKSIQGCVFGYTQSDEISLVLTKPTINSSVWFEYEVQKLCSVAASMATLYFMQSFFTNMKMFANSSADKDFIVKMLDIYESAYNKGAMFDARCFNIPESEVVNCIFWRQIDAKRNSVQMLGRSIFSHKELDKKSSTDIMNMCKEKGNDWEALSNHLKWGTAVYYSPDDMEWVVDKNMPLLRGDDREYLQKLVVMNQDPSPKYH